MELPKGRPILIELMLCEVKKLFKNTQAGTQDFVSVGVGGLIQSEPEIC